MEEIYDALVDLKATMEKQMALQEQTNAILRALIDAVTDNSQTIAEANSLRKPNA
jgi:hypothetical protein